MARTVARRVTGVLSLLLLVGGLAACNTIEGAGEDIESAGEAIDQSAEEAQN